MSSIRVDYDILNQKQTPAFYASSLATRPAFGFPGRIFIDTDTPSSGIYRDTGSAWVQVADPGAGTTGTLQQVTTNGNTTTLGVTIEGLTIGKGTGSIASNTAIGNLALNSNTTGSVATAIGKSALQNNTSGTGNTAIGSSALFTNSIGIENTGVGANSLYSNTSGMSNTAIGSSSLYTNSVGFGNTAIGTQSLFSNTIGSRNTAIGNASLNANIIGDDNTAIGNSALNTNTGSFNTAIGSSSLQINTTGTQNTAIGYLSLSLNTTGTQNTALGNNALQKNTTGSFNTAIGQLSLNTNTTGATNTAVGSQSLQLNTTGQLNTAIGNGAGSLITTGSNNTILGNYAGTSALASNIVLADGNGNVRLFSDANGLIAINQSVGSVPGGQLDIHTAQTYALVLNGLTTNNAYIAFSNNSVGQWRVGNNYNAGANSFDIFNLGTSSNAITITSTNNIGIGTTSLTGYSLRVGKNLTGASTSYGIAQTGSVQSGVTSVLYSFYSQTNTAAASFTLGTYVHYMADNSVSLGAGSVVTNQYGFLAQSSLTSATNNYGFAGNIASGTNRWNLYMAGTAANYMAGQLLIGTTTTSAFALDVNGTGKFGSYLTIGQTSYLAGTYSLDVITGGISGISDVSRFSTQGNGGTGRGVGIVLGASGSTSTVSVARLVGYQETASATANNASFAIQVANSSGTLTEYIRVNNVGGVGVGVSTIVASAKVQIDSTISGFLPPRMTTTEKNAISSPATGLVIFDTTLGKLCVFSTTWQTITSV